LKKSDIFVIYSPYLIIMKKIFFIFYTAFSLCFILIANAQSPKKSTAPGPIGFDKSRYTIPFKLFVLKNGLTLIIHEDHSAPVVSVNTWYHVGSKNEKKGKTGFAHLFEHFFFNGSINYPHGFREAMDDVGANNRNGTTNGDRTNFFEDVPVSALERTLYLEADRMGFLKLSKEMLERERGVVQNEKRQGENQPLGKAYNSLSEKLYPAQHPYSWSTIGSMEDLNAATPDDIKEWYQKYYGPNNMVLSLAGDITPEKGLELVKRYYEGITPVPPISRMESWVPKLPYNIREAVQDQIPETVLLRVYHLPNWKSNELEYLKLFSDVLSGSKSSILSRRLVYDKQLASSVSTEVEANEIASLLYVSVTVKKGASAAAAEKEMDAAITSLITTGPTVAENEMAKTRRLSSFSRVLERTGGMGGKSDILAESMAYGGSPSVYLDKLEIMTKATPADVKAAAQKWLLNAHYTMVATPYPAMDTTATGINRSALPVLAAAPNVSFPKVQRAKLKNGLNVLLLERNTLPVVNVTLAINAGFSSDVPAKAGAASLALDLLDKGTATKNLFTISDDLDRVGAELSTRSEQDMSIIQLSALTQNLKPSLTILSDVLLHPAFPADQFLILKDQRLATIGEEKTDPVGVVYRNLPALVYGKQHAYGMPQTGTGYTESVKSLTRADLINWHSAWFKPNNSTLIVTGNVAMAKLLPELEAALGSWKPGDVATKNINIVPATKGGVVYLIDKPEATQSVIVASHVAVPGGSADDVAIETFMRNFGGISTSRLNRNLRLDKHWSYGTSGGLTATKGQRLFLTIAPVQTDKTKEAMAEVNKEIKGVAGSRPLEGEEYNSIMRNMSLRLPARFSTLQSLESAAINMIKYNLPDDYWQNYATNVRGLTEKQLNDASKKYIHPNEMIWLVVGDLKKIEAGVKELNYGTIIKLNADGNVIK